MPAIDLYRHSTALRHLAAALGVLTVAWYAGPACATDCARTVTPEDLESVISEAEAALSRLEVEKFKGLVDGAEAMLPCLDGPVEPRLAASFHRAYGIRAFGARDPIAERAFAAARYAEPEFTFSKALIPEGNPVRREYERAPWQNRATLPAERPEVGAIYVDGVPSEERPLSWPAVIQWLDDDKQPRFTEYVLPGEKLPEYPLWVPPEVPVKKPPAGLIATSIVAGVASGALYGVALAEEARYKDTVNDPVPDARLDDLRRTTNTLVIASAVSATAAVGMGVAVVVAW